MKKLSQKTGMDSFCGKFHGCEWISVDRFDGDRLCATAFFLSHCHIDHMHGLHSDKFYELLSCKSAVLYCHKISKIFLGSVSQYKRLLEYIVVKDYNEKFTIAAICADDEHEKMLPASSADVTFLDAQHIPGSIMILFEFSNGYRLLYTADFRLSKDDWIACEALKDPLTRSGFKRLDALYFDSTFCRRGAENLPTQKQSRALCVRMVKEWLEKEPSNKVLLWCGKYGHEFLLKAVCDELHIKCHVTIAKYRVYKKIDYLADCITPCARDTRVHACTEKPSGTEEVFHETNQCVMARKRNDFTFKQKISACWQCRPNCSNVRVIKPSAIWFARRSEKNVLGYENDRFCRLLYSGHSSLTEVEEAMSVLRPVCAYPNSADKHCKYFSDKLIKYFSPYYSGSSISERSLPSVGSSNETVDEITLPDSPEMLLKRNATCDVIIDDSDCEVID